MNCSPATYFLSLIIFLFSLTALPPRSYAQEAWHPLTGPDNDFTIWVPGASSHQTKITPQKPFTGQKMELYIYQNGSDSFTFSYKDLPTRAGALNKETVLTEYERGLFVDGWLIKSQSELPDGGWQYESVMNLPGGKITEQRQARMQTRAYFRSNRMYTLSVVSVDANHFTAHASRFLSSMRFLRLPPTPPAPRRQALSAREMVAARGALKALRRLAVAEEVAPNYDQYVKLLLEVKGEVDDYLADLRPGEAKYELSSALEAYMDLQRAWNATRGFLTIPVIGFEPQRTLIIKYGIPIDKRGDMPIMDFQEAIFTIFKAAREHIDRASTLLRG